MFHFCKTHRLETGCSLTSPGIRLCSSRSARCVFWHNLQLTDFIKKLLLRHATASNGWQKKASFGWIRTTRSVMAFLFRDHAGHAEKKVTVSQRASCGSYCGIIQHDAAPYIAVAIFRGAEQFVAMSSLIYLAYIGSVYSSSSVGVSFLMRIWYLDSCDLAMLRTSAIMSSFDFPTHQNRRRGFFTTLSLWPHVGPTNISHLLWLWYSITFRLLYFRCMDDLKLRVEEFQFRIFSTVSFDR